MDKGVLLRYYKREDIQKALISYAKDREIAISYGEKGYGKRPDILEYPRDVLELVKEGASSFHVSEEIWKNPKQLNPMLKRLEINTLRKGWDLVLDIDSPFWKLSKIITWLLIKALKEHGIKSVSCKFSGNKGFHIGVPFEAFPAELNGKNTSDLFPDAPRAITGYLLDYIEKNYIKIEEKTEEKIKFGDKFVTSFQKLKETTKKDIDELTTKYCSKKECGKIIKKDIGEIIYRFVCPKCGENIKSSESFIKCPKCGNLTEKTGRDNPLCECGSNEFHRKFNALAVTDVDTLLISPRHLYRMPYSINEKSGLISTVINPSKVLNFEKKYAIPEKTKITKFEFLNTKNIVKDEAKQLIINAYEFLAKKQEETINKTEEDFDIFEEAAPKEVFPPCIKTVLQGLKDGKKRSLFLLVNFLICCGWTYDKIEELLREWNNKNEEPLREVLILGQLRYHKQQKKKILPPNCINQMYYKDMQICKPDQICKKIKNPVNYAKRKVFFLQKGSIEKQPKREKLTEEQKEMRRKYKEKLKKR